jgi:hypothetical protein
MVDDNTSIILGVTVQHFMQLGGCADSLHPLILSHVFGLMQFCNGISTFVRRIVRSPLMMQPSCPGLSLVTRAGFIVMTLRQNNSPPNGKVQKDEADIKGTVQKEFILEGQTVNSA